MLAAAQYGQPAVLDPNGPFAPQPHDQVVPLAYAIIAEPGVTDNGGYTGAAAVTLDAFTSAASGSFTTGTSGSVAVTLAAFTSSASGTVTPPSVTGTASPTLGAFTSTATGKVGQVGTVAVTLGPFISSAGVTPKYPASISGRKFLDQNGNVIQLRSLSSWGLAQIPDNTTMTARLEAAAARGFNSVTVVMDGANDYGTGWERWQNAATNKPFYATTSGGSTAGTPFVDPLGAGWTDHITHLMNETKRLGMFVLASNYTGNGGVGSAGAMVSAGSTACRTTGQRWATFLATWDHWILHIGADDAAPPTTQIEQFCRGVKDIRPGVLIVAEPDNGSDALAQWPPGSFTYFTPIEAMYNYGSSSTSQFETTYSGDPNTGPVWDCEPAYIGAAHYSGTASVERQNLRERHYVVPIEGGVGLNNGHEDWWRFGAAGLFTAGDTDATAMNNTSVVEWQYGWTIWDLMTSSSWAPTSSLITTGEGTGDTKAAQGTDGATAVAYFPNSRTTVVDTTIINGTGQVRLRWYDPTAGTFSTIASAEAQNASRSVTFPSNHADGTSDFVLVIELQPTGSVAVTLGNFTSTATGTFTPPPITGTSATTLGTFTSTATGSFTPQPITGTAAPTLGSFTTTTAGTVGQTGTSATTLGNFTSSAIGTFTPPPITGTAAPALAAFTSTATGQQGETGTSAVTLGAFTSSATGTFSPAGSGFAAITLGPFVATATGTRTIPPITGTAAATLAPFAPTATGTATPPPITGTAAVTLAPFTAAASGTRTLPGSTGTVAVTLGSFTSTGTGTRTVPSFTGTAAIVLGAFVAYAVEILHPFIRTDDETLSLTSLDVDRTLEAIE